MEPAKSQFWEWVAATRAAGGTRLHIGEGHPPMMRRREGDLAPIDPAAPPLDSRDLVVELTRVIDPDAWDRAEDTGSADARLTDANGVAVKASLFRAGGKWKVVVHL